MISLYQSLKYKLKGETKSSVSHLAYKRDDGLYMAELYQFTCDHNVVDLQILFDRASNSHTFMIVVGIEFRPMEKVEHKEDENQPISDSDVNWEVKIPTDYEEIMKLSVNRLQWTTKEEVYSIMRNGFLINGYYKEGSIWFSLDKHGKKCLMISAKEAFSFYKKLSLPGSRFGEAAQFYFEYNSINTEVQSQLVSFETRYATYLVYKLLPDQSGFEAPMRVEDTEYSGSGGNFWYIYLVSPQTLVIRLKADQNTSNPPNKLNTRDLPQQRSDGWMEVQLLEFQSNKTIERKCINLSLTNVGGFDKKKFSGLIIEGIEIRPI
ncbi:F-box protein VBF-like [Bidens hawaiensis]|uniref:F-box protein VBF-like n=1 Tax=Bidens hawaiensis TaxID=980011 RepID=UPI00404AA6C6